MINVLDNAIKYSPCGSKIFIRLQKRNDLVRMEIEDQGIGIPRMSITKFFNDFIEEVPRRSWKRVVQESDFFYREKLSKNTQVRLR